MVNANAHMAAAKSFLERTNSSLPKGKRPWGEVEGLRADSVDAAVGFAKTVLDAVTSVWHDTAEKMADRLVKVCPSRALLGNSRLLVDAGMQETFFK